MSAQVTVTLPEDVLQRAEMMARLTGRPLADVIAGAIELSFRPLGTAAGSARPISAWSDEEVLAAAETGMTEQEDQRLSELLDRQQAGVLTEPERGELAALMQIYQEGLLRKAQALREAVRRKLREPLQP